MASGTGGSIVTDDSAALDEVLRLSSRDTVHMFVHYLYVSTSDHAAALAGELRAQGYKAEHRVAGDGASWVVVARRATVPTIDAVSATRKLMERLAALYGGEYDGWEVAVA